MEDDLFQSLGGSLMKDLLADLQGDDGEGDGWLSLEQLEKELSQLDDGSGPDPSLAPSTLGSLPLPPVPTAASMVVTGQQQLQQQQPMLGVGLLGDVTVTTAPADAWKESLQKFTSLSLAGDFLAADKVSKQQQTTPQLPPGFMAEAEDYDATEKATFKPPPGMLGKTSGGGPPGMSAAGPSAEGKARHEQARLAAASLLTGGSGAAAPPPPVPAKKAMSKTPANSEVVNVNSNNNKKRMPKTPRNSVIISSSEAGAEQVEAAKKAAAAAKAPKVMILKKEGEDNAKPPPKTPRNSVVVPSQEAAAAVAQQGGGPLPQQGGGMPMPPHGMPMPQQQQHPGNMGPGMQMQPHSGMGMPPPHVMGPGMQMQQQHPGVPMGGPGMQMQQQHPGMQMPPHMMGSPGGGRGGPVPVAMAAPGGPAWQSGPRPPPPQRPPPMKIFCNPHPGAPPIPAHVLESRYMKSRDITYIVHSMMRPVLMAGISEHDYDIQVLHRRSGGRPAGPRPNPRGRKNPKDKNNKNDDPTLDAIQREMVSREKKTKEWSTKNTALGHLPKSNVARPRALIASPVVAQANQDKSESATEQKQRARLWKARIYCDQAYQAYLDVVDIWAKAAPGSVPPQVHGPLIRLMKCLGITGGSAPASSAAPAEKSNVGGSEYKVDSQVLQLFLKLSKGRTLFARIVEQALLPPSAIQAVLPATLDCLYKNPPLMESNGKPNPNGDSTDDRCFRALTGVIQTLPALSGDSVLQSAEIMKANSEPALSSTSRMECLHALLQRGNGMANTPDADLESYKTQWKETESSFMNILTGM